jgi:hypothetical protein
MTKMKEFLDIARRLWQTARAAVSSPSPRPSWMFSMLRPLLWGLLLAVLLSVFSPGQSIQPGKMQSPASTGNTKAGGKAEPAVPPLLDPWSLYRKGDLAAAMDGYQQLSKDNPKSADAYAGLARVYLAQRNVDLASQTVNKGLAVSDSPSLHVALGEVQFRQGKISEAEQEWVKVINSGHPDARAFLGLARVSDAVAMHKRGKAMIDKARELDSSDPDIERHWIGTLPSSERIKYLERYLSEANDDDAEHRTHIQHYLEYLKARAEQGGGRCRLANNVTSSEIPLARLFQDADHLRGYGLDVKVNDRKGTLMLDTGASGILLDRGMAEKAGITKLVETGIGGIGDRGERSGYVGLAKSITIGGLRFENCPIEVLENRSVVGEEGLIGADVFDDFLIDIDFPAEKLRLSELPKRPEDSGQPAGLHGDEDEDTDVTTAHPATAAADATSQNPLSPPKRTFHDAYIAPEMKSYTRIFRFGHDMLVPAFAGNAPSKLFLIDSGAFWNQITPAAAREVTKVHNDPYTTVTGINGKVKNVYSADQAVIRVGHVHERDQDLVTFDMTSVSDNCGTEISGILGFAMLRKLDVKIDYRDDLVDFNDDRKPKALEIK